MRFPIQIIILLYYLILFSTTYSQTVKPTVLNMGGGSFLNNSHSYQWSIGESTLIGYFYNISTSLSVGVLQPNADIVTGFVESGNIVFKNEIKVASNPSLGDVFIDFKMRHPGIASISLYNSNSQQVSLTELGQILPNQLMKFKMGSLLSGTYFIKITYKMLGNEIKQGVYKVIKL
jgi:hypothetical protein